MYMHGWVPLLSTWNYHSIVNWLHPNMKYKVKEKDGRRMPSSECLPSRCCSIVCLFFTVFFNFLFLWPCCAACWIQFPRQGSNLCRPRWRLRVLTTGPPGKSFHLVFTHPFLRWDNCDQKCWVTCLLHQEQILQAGSTWVQVLPLRPCCSSLYMCCVSNMASRSLGEIRLWYQVIIYILFASSNKFQIFFSQ